MDEVPNQSAPSASVRAIAWAEPEQAPLLRLLAERCGLSWVAAGSPQRGRSIELARALSEGQAQGASAFDDVRSALAGLSEPARPEPGTLMLLAAAVPSDINPADPRLRPANSVRVATIEPIPASLIGTGGDLSATGVFRQVPLFRHARAVRESAEVLSTFGPIRTMAVSAMGQIGAGSLGARLLDAVDLITLMMGEPEAVDAAYAGPGVAPSPEASAAAAPVRMLPGEDLRGLSGDMTVHLRFADGRSALAHVSDSAGAWRRTATVVGSAGRIDLDDESWAWSNQAGKVIDELKPRPASARSGSERRTRSRGPSALDSLAESISRLLDPGLHDPPPARPASALACAVAAVLSARTGQPEFPATLRRLAGADDDTPDE
jgi:hypothetical protein